MRCKQVREMLSAQLDGEDSPSEREAVDAHLAECLDCRRWLDRAAAVTRLARTSLVTPVRDLSETVLAAVPQPRHPWMVSALRIALGVVGAMQLLLGLAQIGQGAAGGHVHGAAGGTVTPGHLWHESAAWNVAVGAGFLFIAVRRTRAKALLPTLTAFVAMLCLLSINDLAAGRVAPLRLVTHGLVLAGYLIIVALSRPSLDPGEPPGEHPVGRPRWRVRFDDQPETVPSGGGLRLVSPPGQRGSYGRPSRSARAAYRDAA
jgi:predicted anti-sigma-YlaC factor YlaD